MLSIIAAIRSPSDFRCRQYSKSSAAHSSMISHSNATLSGGGSSHSPIGFVRCHGGSASSLSQRAASPTEKYADLGGQRTLSGRLPKYLVRASGPELPAYSPCSIGDCLDRAFQAYAGSFHRQDFRPQRSKKLNSFYLGYRIAHFATTALRLPMAPRADPGPSRRARCARPRRSFDPLGDRSVYAGRAVLCAQRGDCVSLRLDLLGRCSQVSLVPPAMPKSQSPAWFCRSSHVALRTLPPSNR